MADVDYVIGRLHGINELVKILRDLVKTKAGAQKTEIIQVMTEHISSQLDSVLAEFQEMPHPPEKKELAEAIQEKHAESKNKIEEAPTPEKKLEQHSKSVDELLKDLESLRNE